MLLARTVPEGWRCIGYAHREFLRSYRIRYADDAGVVVGADKMYVGRTY